ncbi:MAG: lipoprotein-releasing ABC transporter permease subunit [Gammaproteobacteria bacterium]|nr:lipoprotein-releasing ABC transporter permease subunit [Gammaproteobacteria bacterium]
MFKPLELFIGLRYTRAKRRHQFISFITLASLLGVALGVTALITVMSVMNGFEQELRKRTLDMTAHASIHEDNNKLGNWQAVADAAAKHPQVIGQAPYIQAEGMLSYNGEVQGTIVNGVRPDLEGNVSNIGKKMSFGRFEDLKAGEFGIVLGVDLARTLNVLLGDKITLIVPQAAVTPAGILPRLKRFTVVGVFDAGMYEYDSAFAYVHLDDASRLFRMHGEVTGLRLQLKDMLIARTVSRELVQELPGRYFIRDWTQQHANFFRAVQIEKTVMFIILSLIIAVAAFNLVSMLVMVVMSKDADIAILRTLGATPGMIMRVFMVQGTVIGLFGILLGGIGGITLSLNVETIVPFLETIFGFDLFPSDVYYISDLPSELKWSDVAQVCGVAFGFCLVATLYPAWRGAKVQPAEALRYE